jgi:hypothetical protein
LVEEVDTARAVAIVAAEAATAMSGVANDAMAAVTAEEVPVAAGARQDMAAIEGAVAMATAADTAAVTTTTTISRHTVFKTR